MKLTRLLFEKEIARVHVFGRMNYKFINMLVRSAKPFEAQVGDVIFNFGDVCDEIVFIMTGIIRIETKSGSRDVIAGYAYDGGYFGDFEYISRSLRIARYTAVSKCTLLAVKSSDLEAAMLEHFEAGD